MKISNLKIKTLVLIAIVTFLIISFFSVILIKEMENTQAKDTRQYLQEVGIQYKNSIVKQINGDFQTLKAIATVIANEDLDLDSIIDKIRVENNNNPFLRMGYITTDYQAYIVDTNGSQYNNIDLSNELFVQQAMSGQDALSELFEDDFGAGKIICYGVPLCKDGKVIGAVSATLEASMFANIINSEIFNNKGFSHVVDSDGDIIIRSSHQDASQTIKNIFDTDTVDAALKEELTKNLSSGIDGFFEMERMEHVTWCSYVNIGINDWYILTVVPKAAVNANFEQLLRVTIITIILVIVAAAILVIAIIYAIKKSQQSIIALAYFDNLTGLYNRNKFLSEAKSKLKRRQDYALVFIDIDNFKFYNELFGYETGDLLLKKIAEIISRELDESECCFRDNADIFGALLLYQDKNTLKIRVKKIIDQITNTQKTYGQRYNIVCNCGVKIMESYSDKIDIDIFMDRASMALSKAKGMHTNQICFYDDELHASANMKNNIETRMYQALENKEFQVYLQPKINLSNEHLNSAEALIRWQLPNGMMIYPDQFISIFEANGFITKVDLYMLEEVCANLRQWLDQVYAVKPISVNQSRRLFYQEDYLDQITRIIKKHRIDPSLIILEITEYLMMENVDEIEVILQSLKKKGFRLSLDDFGSGYSSFNTLKDLTIDELKIDKLFLSKTDNKIKSDAILKCIIKLAKELSIKTVAEGVETKEQCLILKRLGCDVIQGYYYDRPMSLIAFVEKYLKNTSSNIEK